jgi:DNA-binding transcriptional LysR family regulator
LGVSLISASFAQDEVRAGKVKLIALADVNLWRELGLVYRRDRSLPLAGNAFVTLIRQRTPLQSAGGSASAASSE